MLSRKLIEEYIMSLPHTQLSFPHGEKIAVYSAQAENETEMFALIPTNKTPLQISLRCDPKLSELLREKYESVMPGENLNKKYWNTIIISGQLSDQEVLDLILHSYNLVTMQRQT